MYKRMDSPSSDNSTYKTNSTNALVMAISKYSTVVQSQISIFTLFSLRVSGLDLIRLMPSWRSIDPVELGGAG